MKLDIEKIIKKELERYKKVKEIEIGGKKYNLYVVPDLCDEDINLYEGFLFVKTKDKKEVSYFKTKYKSPVDGYAPRLTFIIYEDNYLLIKDYRRNKHIIKTLKKINRTFLNKLKKAIRDPTEENLKKLFDRTDVIEEFYILYKKSREYLLKNIKGISEEEKREEFVDNFMMQMLTLWYLQERGFFNNDTNYFITKFKEMYQKKLFSVFDNYYQFLNYLFEKISGYEDAQYYEDEYTGKVVVIGPAVFLNGGHNEAITIPDECFYREGITEVLIETPPNKVGDEVPLFNLFESRDWTEGNIDEFVLGAIYEKLINYMERKKLGAYYTPEEITSYICENTIKPYLVDRVNERFSREFKNIDHTIEEGDKEIILYLFKELKEIKVLDPAVGSAHFLESAINTLLDVYEKIWYRAKDIGIEDLDIITTDERGDIKKINLMDIKNEDEFQLLVKFFIILSKNIYGVDINPSAIKVAKARLFLTLAKHFKVRKGRDLFIRFPNVHFNLRVGNSLIGYVDLKREEGGEQVKLDMFLGEGEVNHIVERIKVVKELESYLKKIAKSLDMEGDILKEIGELNRILSKDKINWGDLKRVLEVKEKLITILIASLNSKYAIPLNELLRDITEIFNQKLDEKFAEEYGIDLEDLKKVKTFHWIFEFPEVFLERGGFDVVIGNPPYIRQEGINHIVENVDYKEILSKLYEPFSSTFDFSMFFILRSIQILKDRGYHSFIITNKWLRAKYGKKIRKYLRENVRIMKVIDLNGVRVFVGATVDTIIYIIKKEKVKGENLIFYNHPLDITNIEQGKYFVKQSSLSDDVWSFIDEETLEIKKWIERVGKPLKELDVKIYRGVITGFNEAFIIDDEVKKKLTEEDPKSEELIKPVLRGRDIGRYYAEWNKKWIILIPSGFTKKLIKKDNLNLGKAEEFFKEEYPAIYSHFMQFKNTELGRGKGLINRDDQGDFWWELRACDYYPEFEKPKIVWQEIVKEPSFYLDFSKLYCEATSFIMTLKKEINNINLIKLILFILNSKISWTAIKLYGTNLGENTVRYKKTYTEKIPIRLPNNPKFFEIIADYLLFLNTTEERRKKLKEIIEFFDRQIADCLVYELYFKEKFAEDGLYPEPKEYLLETVSKLLKPINYDRWAELYWKKQLEENIS
ncbi:N-6 DNA methylase, partial [Methanothermococcus sp. SCGC AD-155-N22]|nr:N-6 DNA methylase [Methanothermococcus sp. SCGC AD-155-N22]